jgi:hypothetical protein
LNYAWHISTLNEDIATRECSFRRYNRASKRRSGAVLADPVAVVESIDVGAAVRHRSRPLQTAGNQADELRDRKKAG